MPAIWFGTVVLWKEVEQEKQKGDKNEQEKQKGDKKKTEYKRPKDIKNIRVYVHRDINEEEAERRIVDKYIETEGRKDLKLWEAFAKGLLQVYDIEPTPVTPPPEDDE